MDKEVVVLVEQIKEEILRVIDGLGQDLFKGSNYSNCIILRDLYFWIREQEGETISLEEQLNFLDKYKKGAQ